jgi:hypothetical protein
MSYQSTNNSLQGNKLEKQIQATNKNTMSLTQLDKLVCCK